MLSTPKILVADDNPEALASIRAGLSGMDAELVLAGSGKDALRMAMALDEAAVVVLDVSMPDMGGFEVAELLRRRPRFANAPIIFMTGVAMEQHEVFHGYELGAVDYIFKPVDLHVLRSKVGVFVELKRQAEELRRLNEVLEQRVEERTSQLASEIVERKRAQEEQSRLATQLHQAQKLEAVGTLANGIAHDFNNLLMGISGCASMALLAVEPDSPARRYLNEILSAADSGAAITRQLLAFSRKREIEPKVFELNQTVTAAKAMLRRLLGEHIDLRLELDDGGSRIRADPGQIEQVLMNLAVNAHDAMPDGGKLIMATERTTLPAGDPRNPERDRARDYVKLSVHDTGMGMSEEVRSRVFEPFFTTKQVGKGTGLGLATVYGVVKQAQGHIDVISELGRGTRFEILLPYAHDPVTVSPPPPRVKPHVARETILLVEDDPLVRMTVHGFLQSQGYRVIEAETGTEAIEKCRRFEGEIHGLLTDTVLPGLSGKQVAARVEALRPNIKTVFMSAHAASWLIDEGRLPAGARTLQKPFGKDLLLSTLMEVFGRSPSLFPSESDAGATGRVAPTVLLVEDQASARLAIAAYLTELGYAVLEASSPAEALDQCKRTRVHVVLTDYGLQTMKGDALTREVRRTWPEAAVIYMSGYDDVRPDPVGPVLKKPLDLSMISSEIAEVAGLPESSGKAN